MPQVRHVGLDDRYRQRRRRVRAVSSALHNDPHSYRGWLPGARRHEAGEHGVVQMGVIRTILRRTGLAVNDEAPGSLGARGGYRGPASIVGDLEHHVLQVTGYRRAYRLAEHGRRLRLDDRQAWA